MRYYVLDEHEAAKYAADHERETDVDNWCGWYLLSDTEALRLLQLNKHYLVVTAKVSDTLYRLTERDIYELIKSSVKIDEQQ